MTIGIFILKLALALSLSGHSAEIRSGGPLSLRLELRSTKVHLEDHVFVRLTLANRGKDVEAIAAWEFRGSDELDEVWYDDCRYLSHPLIEIRDSAGKVVKPVDYFPEGLTSDSPFEQKVTSASRETSEQVKGWRASGLSDAEIDRRLRAGDERAADAKRAARYPAVALKPDSSVRTVGWCSGHGLEAGKLKPDCPGSGLVELPFFKFTKPGIYRIRASYQGVRTPWTRFEVER